MSKNHVCFNQLAPNLAILSYLYTLMINQLINTPIMNNLSTPNNISSILFNNNPLPLFFTCYLILYLNAYFIIFRKWARSVRPEASSCAISLAHGTPAVFLAVWAVHSGPARNFHSENTLSQNMVLEYSIAYFLMDLVHLLVFSPSDYLYICHHLATLFVFVTCRYVVGHGAFAVLVLLALAEVTSLCQNVWTLAGVQRFDVEFAAKVYDGLSVPFYAVYSVVRGVLGPCFVYKMVRFYGSGIQEGVIPKWAWVSWVLVIGMAISVSLLWVSNLWFGLYKEMKKNAYRKIL